MLVVKPLFGTVLSYNPLSRQGRIKPDSSSHGIFWFHFSNGKAITYGDKGISWTGSHVQVPPLPEPKAGDKVVFQVDSVNGQYKANPWGYEKQFQDAHTQYVAHLPRLIIFDNCVPMMPIQFPCKSIDAALSEFHDYMEYYSGTRTIKCAYVRLSDGTIITLRGDEHWLVELILQQSNIVLPTTSP